MLLSPSIIIDAATFPGYDALEKEIVPVLPGEDDDALQKKALYAAIERRRTNRNARIYRDRDGRYVVGW